jgi:hypothetical protein
VGLELQEQIVEAGVLDPPGQLHQLIEIGSGHRQGVLVVPGHGPQRIGGLGAG